MRFVIALLLAFMTTPIIVTAQGYDPQAPCGRDENGNPYACNSVSPNMLEATCLTSASPYYCLPYHQRACQTGFQVACTVAQYGQQCNGGDPAACQYYVAILEANRACNLNGDQGACNWITQQGF